MFESTSPIDPICEAARAESQATARRLNAVADLMELRFRQHGDRADWVADVWDEVSAELAAALRISRAQASRYMSDAEIMRERLPKVGECLAAGDINYVAFSVIALRTALITDEAALATVDEQVALRAPRWPSSARGRLAMRVDAIVARVDRDAIRRANKEIKDRYLNVSRSMSGVSEIYGNVFASAAKAFDRRLNELASSVCEADPRTKAQRRADALTALVAGVDRMACTCEGSACVGARGRLRDRNVIIHVVADQSAVDGSGGAPGYMAGVDELIPPQVVAELAKTATLRPLAFPSEAEPRYTPSAKLAEFVRCRDLTCRAPGCDVPAVRCDIDHTKPFADGGATHPSNLKALCRKHHLLKTFWGWQDRQLADGTVIWTLPSGRVYVTSPGSALLFPALAVSTGDVPQVPPAYDLRCGDRTAMMPTRSRTRSQHRAQRIAAERRHNHDARMARGRALGYTYSSADDPPF
ncbi:HNH endonuclease signature motif containing protein [Candidatus Mycobacterium wuenschmannii]|uniref:HNH endonuclease signature motif containing protein n=1 Tax=Candidatus Mycobacterium wuenschmannii TaxID=3027808 RepID=A0ABY8VSG1_9MYCO|nr:HNH endonuclease signature motif containing protein [Candidatus Mycobacterium wuenschmannii]WIM85881.1 HNH endonuclease signature motif containing protein [Candidatus Mycobacterium wuenschmannii]